MGTSKISHKCSHRMGWTINPFILQTLIFHPPKSHPSKGFFRTAGTVSQIIKWDFVNGQLRCGVPRTTQPSFTALESHGETEVSCSYIFYFFLPLKRKGGLALLADEFGLKIAQRFCNNLHQVDHQKFLQTLLHMHRKVLATEDSPKGAFVEPIWEKLKI